MKNPLSYHRNILPYLQNHAEIKFKSNFYIVSVELLFSKFSLGSNKMKHNIFKIRKVGEPTDAKEFSQVGTPHKKPEQIDNLKTSIEFTNKKMVELMAMFEGLMKNVLQQTATPNNNNSQHTPGTIEREVRDRYVQLPLPSAQTITKQQTEKWITEVCVTAFSTSFHYYITEQMTFEQTKVFCSENVLRNLLRFTSKYKLTDKQIQNVNKHIGQKVLQYLQKKYPLTQSNDVNKALQKEVQQTNHLDLLTNDFLYTFGIIFQYSPDGNYNGMIMRVINKAIQIAEQTSLMFNLDEENKKNQDEETNYNDFQAFMSDMFDNVYDEDWMVGSRAKADRTDSQATYIAKKVNAQSHKDKYEEKVKSYTNYLIGRKISENTVPYTQSEIKGKNLIIKSPAILRILTKWCQQLWQKFESETYFTERTESIQLQNPEYINPFFKWMKAAIDTLAIAQKKEILAFKAELDRNSFNQQSEFLQKHLQQDNITCIPQYEKASGKFATQMVKNLHSYITLYLNRLIHGLLTISKKFYEKQVDRSWDDWQSPPNLITFKIGDLLRCKMSSKQKEIVKVFKEIKRISNINPKKMKIVRIKNRLKQGTNDILINIKFNNLIICEIQLEVINKSKTKFIQCSNTFSHYIYEMKRSIFGPISELCNIWNNFQARANEYESLISTPNGETAEKVECLQGKSEHQLAKFDLPFQCSYCKRLYYHNNYIITNKKCQKCNKYQCVKCQINMMNEIELKKVIFSSKKQKQLSDSCKRNKQRTIPKVGVCVKIQSTLINAEVFKITKYEGKTWLLGQKDGQVYNIKRLYTQKDTDWLLDNFCIFEISMNSQKFINISDKMTQNFSMKTYMKDSLKQQKDVLILTQIRYTVPEMIELLKVDEGFERNKRKIKRIQFASNYLSDISFLSCFENITAINLDFNSFTQMKDLCNFKALQKVEMRDNQHLTTFNDEVCTLTRMEEIKITNCKVNALPEKIGDLALLTLIKMDKNSLTKLPDSICNITNLREMSFQSNSISEIPEGIGKLVNLKKLSLKKNKITTVPISIGQLSSLQILNLSENLLTVLPDNMMYLSKLQTLRLQNNQLETLPSSLLSIETLKTLSVHTNKIKVLPNSFNGCKNLELLYLHHNEIEELPTTLGQCINITELTLKENKLQSIPDFLKNLKRLSVVELSSNSLTGFPEFIFQLDLVTKVDLMRNNIVSIPSKISLLEELSSFNISYNKVQALAPELTSLNNLKSILFNNNEITKVPVFIKDIPPIKTDLKNWHTFFNNNLVSEIESNDIFDYSDLRIRLISNNLTTIPMARINTKEKILLIDFNHNKINEIPKDINLFVSLTMLNLSNNLIEVVPKELEQLTKIQTNKLMLEYNPLRQVECMEFCMKVGNGGTRQLLNQLSEDNNVVAPQSKDHEYHDQSQESED